MAGIALRQRQGVDGARIIGLGSYEPSTVVTSEEIAARFGRTGDWVRSRCGISERRFAAPGETVTVMGADAAAKALAQSGLTAGEIDLIIVASCTGEQPVVDVASGIASRLGADTAARFDLNAACSGFCYALAVASDAISAGSATHVLVIGTERMSDLVNPEDLGTSIIFGDGAGAAVLGPADQAGIGPVVWGSDGAGAELIHIPEGEKHMLMAGQTVFRWATTQLHPVMSEACARAGVDPKDLDAIIPHQANLRIIEAMAAKMGAENAVIARDVTRVGNTSAASIPMAMHRMLEEGSARPGGTALLIGFGAGLTYAAQVVRIPDTLTSGS